MSICSECKHKGELSHVCDECIGGEMYEKTVITNADKIRSMTDEELAEFLEKSDFWDEICDECKHLDGCQDTIFCASKTLEWLKREIK